MKEQAYPEPDYILSIAIIAYNSSLFIAELLESILNQKNVDFDQIQMVICDDTSTDNTVEMAEKYQNLFPNFLINTNISNLGITKNCNLALSLCKGKYCILVGGDDIFTPHRVSQQLEWFKKNPQGVLCSSGVEVFESQSGKILGRYFDKDFIKKKSKSKIISQVNQLSSGRFMFNREKVSHIKFDERTPVVSDWLFYNEILFHGDYGDTGEYGLKYRRHQNNTTASGMKHAYIDDRFIAIDLLMIKHPEVYNACRKQRAHTFYNYAKRLYFCNDKKQTRKYLLLSCRENIFNPRALMLFAVMRLGSTGMRLVNLYKRSHWKNTN